MNNSFIPVCSQSPDDDEIWRRNVSFIIQISGRDAGDSKQRHSDTLASLS